MAEPEDLILSKAAQVTGAEREQAYLLLMRLHLQAHKRLDVRLHALQATVEALVAGVTGQLRQPGPVGAAHRGEG